MTNFEVIKRLTLDELADFLHNVQESTIKSGNIKNVDDWKIFLSKELKK